MIKEFDHIFLQSDFDEFARLSGDFNPIHVDQEFSTNTSFGKTVAHGILLTTVLSGALEKTIGEFDLISSKIMFPAPTFADIEMILSVEIIGDDDGLINAKLRTIEKHSAQDTCVIECKIRRGHSNDSLYLETAARPQESAPQRPFEIGASFAQSRQFAPKELACFEGLGGAHSPKGRLSPILLNAMFSKILGIDLPGLGTNYLKQETEYYAAPKIGENIFAFVKITRIRADKKIIDFATIALNEENKLLPKVGH